MMQTRQRGAVRLLIGALSMVVLLGCVMPAPSSPAPAATSATTTSDVTVNVAAMARLGEATQIEIEQFVETPEAGYETAATVTDETVIQEIVSTLDEALPLSTRAPCVEQYRLTFTLSDGTTHTFGYMCQGGESSVLRGDVPFLEDGDVQPPDRLRQLIEAQISAN